MAPVVRKVSDLIELSLSFLSEWWEGERRAATDREREADRASMRGNTVKEIREDTEQTVMFRRHSKSNSIRDHYYSISLIYQNSSSLFPLSSSSFSRNGSLF